MGVELELQLVSLQSFNLCMEAEDFLRRLKEVNHPGEIKPEITQAMIEINSSIHTTYISLLSELRQQRDILAEQACQAHIGICGGGTHPFQKWKEQRIFKTERFSNISEQYGYLAKQFTVFGQHIHIACKTGNDALYLCHAMARYFPQFIALSASSPLSQGVDTAFDCSRLTIISAFPLSGTPPWTLKWQEFEVYYEKMARLNIIHSMKDFYWDIRPKPEYNTVELRICDTPLTVERAAALAAYAQLLINWLLKERPLISKDIYLTYLINRFRAARYGLEAIIIDPIQEEQKVLFEDILETCNRLEPSAAEFNSIGALEHIRTCAQTLKNDAHWIRTRYAEFSSMEDVVRVQSELWNNSHK